MKLRYMDRDTTSAIKGIALILMFVHHFFAFPDYFIEGISYPWVQTFADLCVEPTKIAGSVFAFLTGYFYLFNRNRTLRYTVRKITDLFVAYWYIYLALMIFAIAAGCWEFSLYSFAFEMAALNTPHMVFCWYVLFYSYSMVLLLLLAKQDASPVEDILYMLVLPVVICSVLSGMYLEGFLNNMVLNIRDWYPCMVSGYLCAKYSVFEKLFDRGLGRCKSTVSKVLICLVLAVAASAGRYWWKHLYIGSLQLRSGNYPIMLVADFILAPVFVYGAANVLQYVRSTVLMTLLKQIGKYSMHMWFLHCVFFNVCRDVTQPVLYWPHNPVLVTVWGLIICYIPAVLLDKLIVPTNKLKNRFL